MLGIICAMHIEGEALKAEIECPSVKTVSKLVFTSGKIGGKDVVICTRAIGKVSAGICAEIMIREFGVNAIINTGVGGTLTDQLGILDVAISDAVLQYDVDTTAVGDPMGLISGIDMIKFDADKKLSEIAKIGADNAGINSLIGTIATGDRFINSDDAKQHIRNYFPESVCCEMEGGAVGQVSYMNGVPFIIIRAISDNASGDAPSDYGAFMEKAIEGNVKVVKYLVENI